MIKIWTLFTNFEYLIYFDIPMSLKKLKFIGLRDEFNTYSVLIIDRNGV